MPTQKRAHLDPPHPHPPSRFRLAVAGALLIATASIAGCSGAETPPADASPNIDFEAAEAARDDLIRAVQGAAVLIAGVEVEPYQDIAVPCQTGEGVTFMYDVTLPDNGDVEATYDRIKSHWNALGIETSEDNGVFTSPEQFKAGTGPVHYIVATHQSVGTHPPKYQINGFSLCVPGEPADYYHLTDQAASLNER